jgi:hypothetical protein
MKLILSSILLLILGPCNKPEQTAAKGPSAADISQTTIIYQCTPCFGKCPAYTMTIHGDSKTISYVGKSNTTKIGNYTKEISEAELSELIMAFEKAGFDAMDDQYLGNISDFPTKYITFTYKGKTKKVQHRSGGPENLKQLEKRLSEIAEGDGWSENKISGD